MFIPRFLITNETLKQVGVVEACREVIEKASLVSAWETKFREDALIRAVHYGTHVEGNDLSLLEVEKLIRQDPDREEAAVEVAKRAGVAAKEKDVQEVINYRNVLKYIDQLLAEKKSEEKVFAYKKEQLLQIQALTVEKIVPRDEAGEFRTQQVVIRGVEKGEIVHRPPNAVEVPYQVDELFFWLNSRATRELHPVLKAAVVLYELSRIHPFTIGNGRTARALGLLILAVEGIDGRRFFSIEENFDKNINDYYKAFVEVAKRGGDMGSWIEFFSRALAVEMSKVKEKVERLSLDSHKIGHVAQSVPLNSRQIKLIEFLESNETMTMTQARQILPSVSDDTVLRDLKDLIRKVIITKKGRTKGARYFLKR